MGLDAGGSGRDSNRVVLQRVEWQCGSKIDMANLVARGPREGGEKGRRGGPVTIAFESVRGQFAWFLCAVRFLSRDEICVGSGA